MASMLEHARCTYHGHHAGHASLGHAEALELDSLSLRLCALVGGARRDGREDVGAWWEEDLVVGVYALDLHRAAAHVGAPHLHRTLRVV